jgi:hypothetical protein
VSRTHAEADIPIKVALLVRLMATTPEAGMGSSVLQPVQTRKRASGRSLIFIIWIVKVLH